jgi:transposase
VIPAGVQIYVALETIDLRYGFERLSGLVREQIGYEPTSGALFVFCGRRRSALKILFADIFRVLPYWPRDRFLELAPKYWRNTRERLRDDELARALGHITVPQTTKEQTRAN